MAPRRRVPAPPDPPPESATAGGGGEDERGWEATIGADGVAPVPVPALVGRVDGPDPAATPAPDRAAPDDPDDPNDPNGPTRSEVPDSVAPVIDGAGAYVRDEAGQWRRGVDGVAVTSAGDLTVRDLFDPPVEVIDGEAVRLLPRAWASRRPDHPLAWVFAYADLGGRGPIPVPVATWDERADTVVAMAAPSIHPWNLVAVDGVALLLGVAEATVRAYLARGQMPEPLVRLGRTPVWSREQILAWRATRARARPPTYTVRPAPDPSDGGGEADPGDPDGSGEGAAPAV